MRRIPKSGLVLFQGGRSIGKATKRQAEATRLRISQLEQDQRLGTPHDAALLKWIEELIPAMRTKLAKAGLVEAPKTVMTLDDLIKRFMSVRTVKSSTMASYAQCTDSLIHHFGASKPIDKITAADADSWRAAIASDGRVKEKNGPRSLSQATVAKRTNIAKAIFSKAMLWKLIPSSPFAHMKAGNQANPNREHYVSIADTQQLLKACPNVEWRALIGIARFAGLRCPSEIRELRWTDLNFEQKSLTVRSPKTAADPGHGVRVVPVCVELQPILLDLHEQAKEGEVRMIPRAHRTHTNITAGFKTIIERAGLRPWPRLRQNLRASCATDWANKYPVHESSKWMGHGAMIAAKHYLQPQDLHFKAATGSGPWLSSSSKIDGADFGATGCKTRCSTEPHGFAPRCTSDG